MRQQVKEHSVSPRRHENQANSTRGSPRNLLRIPPICQDQAWNPGEMTCVACNQHSTRFQRCGSNQQVCIFNRVSELLIGPQGVCSMLVDLTDGRCRTVGTLQNSLVHPREVFKPALIEGSAGIILSHIIPPVTPRLQTRTTALQTDSRKPARFWGSLFLITSSMETERKSLCH
jgi:hypothetical protein